MATGIFTKLKRNIVMSMENGEKTVDQNFEAAKQNIDQYQLVIQALKQKLEGCMAHSKGLALMGEQLTTDFQNILQRAPNNQYVQLSNDAKQIHSNFSKSYEDIEKTIEGGCHRRLNSLMDTFASFRDRTKTRNESRDAYDYYVTRVKKLHASRDKLLGEGKRESDKDMDARLKTEKKLEDATQTYTSQNDSLIVDMTNVFNSRFDVLGPCLTEFIASERSFAQAYQSNLQMLRLPTVMPSMADLQAAASAASSAMSSVVSNAASSAAAAVSGVVPIPPPRK